MCSLTQWLFARIKENKQDCFQYEKEELPYIHTLQTDLLKCHPLTLRYSIASETPTYMNCSSAEVNLTSGIMVGKGKKKL